MSFNCPDCNRQYSVPIRNAIICNNDCGTVHCLCGLELYQNEDKEVIKGHHPSCGSDLEPENVSSKITITSLRQY